MIPWYKVDNINCNLRNRELVQVCLLVDGYWAIDYAYVYLLVNNKLEFRGSSTMKLLHTVSHYRILPQDFPPMSERC